VIIKNFNQLAITELRRTALEIIEAGIERVLPPAIIQSAVSYDRSLRTIRVCGETYPLSDGRIFIIGGGKASCLMAASLEKLLGYAEISDGVVICKGTPTPTVKIQTIQAGHPIPDRRGVTGVEKILSLKDKYGINQDDLILCLISGGGSALMPCPVDGLGLEDKRKLTGLLLASGAEILEINCVRKHLSKIKGGRLGYYFSPATVISLVLSDVIGNDLSVIASGPTVPDSSSFTDACAVLEKYDLLSRAPAAAVDILTQGRQGLLEETPKALINCHNYIVGDNNLALEAMTSRAVQLGYRPKIITSELKGDAANTSFYIAKQIENNLDSGYDAFILGGETTIHLPGNPGKGGRNQHYAAASLLAMGEYSSRWVMASVGTDGSDYLPDIAGAIVDNDSLLRLRQGNIDVREYLSRCDSNTLLKKLDNSLIETGDTGTNVGDILVYLFK
jgi:glycerate 2-kinase